MSRLTRIVRHPLVRRAAAFYARRPFLTSWSVLAAGMVAMMLAFSRDAGLNARQTIILAAVTAATAWLCVWIIFLERADPEPVEPGRRGG
jgi:hypothetical protein